MPDATSPTWKAPTSGGSTGRPNLSAVIGLPDQHLGKRIYAVVQVDPADGVSGIQVDELSAIPQ
jgi:hypothetical protein